MAWVKCTEGMTQAMSHFAHQPDVAESAGGVIRRRRPQLRIERGGDGPYRFVDCVDSLCGAFFSNTATKWRPDAGTVIRLPVTIFRAVSFRPYTCSLASSSGRSDVPSSDTPANNPRD